MITPAIDPAFVDFERALYAQVDRDYTTNSFNLGERTYVGGHIYRVDQEMLTEIRTNSAGRQFTPADLPFDPETNRRIHPVAHCVVRPGVSILSKVTRWFSSNGRDTHYLSAEKVSRVPSNLAAWLIQAGHAEAA